MPLPRSCNALWIAVLSTVSLALCFPTTAEEKPADPPFRTVIKAVKFADVSAMVDLIKVIGFDVAVDPKRKLVVLHGPNTRMETAIKLVDALDSPEPPWGIELLVHVIKASPEPFDGPDLPPDMRTPLAEISELFGYRGFELVDTVLLVATTDAGSARARAPLRGGGMVDVGFERATVLYGEPKHSVLFENLSFNAIDADVLLQTNVEVREGHKVLIGKSSLRGGDHDLVLVIEIELQATWPRDEE